MEQNHHSLASRTSIVSLTGSLSLLIFAVISGFASFIFSLTVFQFGLKDRFLNLPILQNFSLGILVTLVFMGLSLFYSQKWLRPRIEEVEESVGEGLLTVLSVILTIILLLLFYFGYSNFLSFIFTRFWS